MPTCRCCRPAELVAKPYGISRETQDAYSLQSQQRTAAAQATGLFVNEIVPVTARKTLVDNETGAVSYEEVTLSLDEGTRPQTVLGDLQNLKPVIEGGCISACVESFKRQFQRSVSARRVSMMRGK